MTKIDEELRKLGWYELRNSPNPDEHCYGFFGDPKDVPSDLDIRNLETWSRMEARAVIRMDQEVNEDDELWPYYIFDFTAYKRPRCEFGGLSLDELEAFYKKTKEFVKIKKCERTKRRHNSLYDNRA